MTDLGPDEPAITGSSPEDRTVGLEPTDDGFAFESDGDPIDELAVDAADALAEVVRPVVEQVAAERSWRFGHVIVDEAQDLTPMQWRMIARRVHGGAITVVGDLAQRSIGRPGEWSDHLPDQLAGAITQELTINYRSPAEINDLASAVLAELAPDLPASRSIRSVGHHPTVHRLDDLAVELRPWIVAHRAANPGGRMAVIGSGLDAPADRRTNGSGETVSWLDPWQAKGLEFDSVVLVEPAAILDRPGGLSLLYVALTRTTDTLAIVHSRTLPSVLAAALTSGLTPSLTSDTGRHP